MYAIRSYYDGEYRGDGHRPFLAAGEPVRRAFLEMEGVDLLQGLDDPGLDVLRGEPEVEGTEGHVVEDRRHEQLVVRVSYNFV